MSKRPWFKFCLGLAVILSLFFLVRSVFPTGTLSVSQLVVWVDQMRVNPWAKVLYVLFFSVGVIALPVTIVPLLGGVLFNFWVAFPLGLVASTLGAWLAFSLARVFGREAVEKLVRGKLKTVDDFTHDQGFKTVIMVRWIGVPPYILANYLFGLSAISVKDYVLGTVIGCAPWIAIVTYFARVLWEALLLGGEKGLQAVLLEKFWPFSLFLIGVLGVVGLQSWFKMRRT